MIVLLFAGAALVYTIFFWRFYKGLIKNNQQSNTEIIENTKVSIVVAFRNESENLNDLLNSLAKQTVNSFQLTLVNDHSTDDYLSVISRWTAYFDDFQLLHLDNEAGKKDAVYKGVSNSKYPIILCTDADCIVPNNWISIMSNSFDSANSIQLVAGIVALKGSSLFQRFQQLEFSALIATSIAAARNGQGVMLNAANMAFRKDFYLDVQDDLERENSPSGDDIFLLSACKRNYPNGFLYLNDKESIVITDAKKSLREFINQRKRWASKAKLYQDIDMSRLTFVVGITNLLILVGGIGSLFSSHLIFPFFLLFGVKSVIDFLILYQYLKGIQQLNLLNYFLIVEFILPIYTIFVAITSQLSEYSWKDRIFKN